MSNTSEIAHWSEYFKEFSSRNVNRPVKLEIFGELGALEEARRIPLAGINVVMTGELAPRLELTFGENTRHVTHTIPRVSRIWTESDDDGLARAVVFESNDGAKTLLTFLAPAADTATAAARLPIITEERDDRQIS